MCGIGFIYSKRQGADNITRRLSHALQRMEHRGPDESNMIVENQWGIGHRRLSIIDLEGSHQPMQTPDSVITLSFNGEIYNYQELRARLSPHWDFTTHGDTEVLLAGLARFGTSFLQELRGMWAFALWDSKREELLLARDRIGKKPLYYNTATSAGFSCASELPALLALLDGCPEEDIDSTADLLHYGFYMPGKTAYRNIGEIMPGHYATWSPAKGLRQTPYWQLQLGSYTGTHTEALDDIRNLIIDSVRRRLVSDVEVGLLLSGGIDSSLLAAVLHKDFSIKPKSFTVGFSQNAYDERNDAKRVAISADTHHFEREFTGFNIEDLRGLSNRAMGQPFGDASLLPTSCAYALASEHVKVVLSGDGADELFSGYQRYQAKLFLRQYLSLPKGLRHLAESALGLLGEPQAHHSRSLVKKAKLFTRYAETSSGDTYIGPALLPKDIIKHLAPELSDRGHRPPHLAEPANADDVLMMMAQDALIYLPQDILTKVDRASMAFSVESRCPFLDADLVDLAFRMPREWNRKGLKGKRMLRDAFKDYLPKTTWRKKKQGFAVPLAEWFCGPLGDQLLTLLESRPTPEFSRTFIDQLLSDHRARKTDYSMGLWVLYNHLDWKQHMTRRAQ